MLSEGPVPPRSGQTGVEVAVEPLDPAPRGAAPAGLVVASGSGSDQRSRILLLASAVAVAIVAAALLLRFREAPRAGPAGGRGARGGDRRRRR